MSAGKRSKSHETLKSACGVSLFGASPLFLSGVQRLLTIQNIQQWKGIGRLITYPVYQISILNDTPYAPHLFFTRSPDTKCSSS